MYSDLLLPSWIKDQSLRAPAMKNGPAFYRNLERALDVLRADHVLMTAKPRWDRSVMDFTTSDFLSHNRTGRIRTAFLEELGRQGEFELSAAGSRVQYGNYNYLIEVEKEIADFFGAETAYMTHSGFNANVGAVAAVPLPGDAVVYDELVHASTHEGLKLSVAAHKISFRHNDVDNLVDILTSLKSSYPAFQSGAQSILICVESIYSMNGDVCPIKEFVSVVKEMFPLGNAQFVMDEAHSTGVLGPRGAGLVSMLGLEKEIAIRVHVCSKGMASTGGLILCNETIRSTILNQARFALYSGAPSLPMVASMRAGLHLLKGDETQKAQEAIQCIVRYFFETLLSNPIWNEAADDDLLSCPLAEDWELRPYHTHIVPIHTRTRHEQYLFFHLCYASINAYHIAYPIVPKGSTRVRLVFHAHNTKEEVDALVNAICSWAREMLDIEHGETENSLPTAARQVYILQASM